MDDRDFDEAPLIYDIVFGESVLNDAVAIVLFSSFETFTDRTTMDATLFFHLVLSFLKTIICSTLVGVAVGFLSSWIFKASAFRHNSVFDVPVILILAFSSYFIAASLGLSGLFAIFFFGICAGHYTWSHSFVLLLRWPAVVEGMCVCV